MRTRLDIMANKESMRAICRAVEIAQSMMLSHVVPHALFLALYETNRKEIEKFLSACGVDSTRYCQKVAAEINAMPKDKPGKTPPLHSATERIVMSASGGRGVQHATVQDLIKALFEADGIGADDPFAELDALVGHDSRLCRR